MFLPVQYAIILIMLFAVGVVDRKRIQRIYKARSIKMEPMMKLLPVAPIDMEATDINRMGAQGYT